MCLSRLEHSVCDQKATGSNPSVSTKISPLDLWVRCLTPHSLCGCLISQNKKNKKNISLGTKISSTLNGHIQNSSNYLSIYHYVYIYFRRLRYENKYFYSFYFAMFKLQTGPRSNVYQDRNVLGASEQATNHYHSYLSSERKTATVEVFIVGPPSGLSSWKEIRKQQSCRLHCSFLSILRKKKTN